MIKFYDGTTANAADWQNGTTIEVDHPAGKIQLEIDSEAVAVIFDLDGSVLDFALNEDTAINYVNSEVCIALAIKDTDLYDMDSFQDRLDHEALLRADCFGYNLPFTEKVA